jgi:N2,N2-dimethylguanosine tRNA methyltransferase
VSEDQTRSQANADTVWANDGDPSNIAVIVRNLVGEGAGLEHASEEPLACLDRTVWRLPGGCAARLDADEAQEEPQSACRDYNGTGKAAEGPAVPGAACCSGAQAPDVSSESQQRFVSCANAARLLTACAMAGRYFDVIDADGFGSDGALLGPALDAARHTAAHGALVYVASTDGVSGSGRRPLRALAAYGGYTQPHPSANEQALRVLIGGAVRDAALRGLALRPLFSLYASHGPVFRVMLRVTRDSAWHARSAPDNYGFVAHQPSSGRHCKLPFACVTPLPLFPPRTRLRPSKFLPFPLLASPCASTSPRVLPMSTSKLAFPNCCGSEPLRRCGCIHPVHWTQFNLLTVAASAQEPRR